jgi:hypothetical protein
MAMHMRLLVITPAITGDCRRLRRLPVITAITGDYRRLPVIAGDYLRLPAITSDYQRLPGITGDYRRLRVITPVITMETDNPMREPDVSQMAQHQKIQHGIWEPENLGREWDSPAR